MKFYICVLFFVCSIAMAADKAGTAPLPQPVPTTPQKLYGRMEVGEFDPATGKFTPNKNAKPEEVYEAFLGIIKNEEAVTNALQTALNNCQAQAPKKKNAAPVVVIPKPPAPEPKKP